MHNVASSGVLIVFASLSQTRKVNMFQNHTKSWDTPAFQDNKEKNSESPAAKVSQRLLQQTVVVARIHR
jgi:hypothetical protein